MPSAATQYEMMRSERSISLNGRGISALWSCSSKRSAAMSCSQASSPTPVTQCPSCGLWKTRRSVERSRSPSSTSGRILCPTRRRHSETKPVLGRMPVDV